MRDGSGRYGRVVLLGGTSEIGLAIVAALELQPGAEVILAGRDVAALDAVPLPVGVHRRSVRWDAAEAGSGAALAAELVGEQDLDLVIAAAGALGSAAAESPEATRALLMTNLVGLIDAVSPLAQALRAQRHGTIVVLSSVAGLRARKTNYVYGATKAGLDAYASGLADALAPDGVKVLVVRPGFVHGRMTQGMKPAPLATTPAAVGVVVRDALAKGSDVAWAPAALKVLAPVLQLVPRKVWRQLKM